MKQVSSKFQDKMQDNLRSWVPKIEIDGNEIPCDIKTGLTINLGSCGPEEFNIGAVFVPSITATISDCSVALQNKEIKLSMGLVLEDRTIEYVPVGYFTVEKPNKGKFDTSFTAYGRLMSKMGGLYESELTYPATINSVITEISTKTGVKINLVGLTGTGLIPTKPTELNYRETAQMIAGLLGGFVTENSEGEVVICKYELDDALTVDTAICYEYPFVHDEKYLVTGLSVNTGTEEFSYGTPNINMTNGYMTASLFETCKGNIIGFSYMPGSVKFLGDIRLDPWNSLKVTDEDNEYQIPCMDIVHIWDGGLITTVQAPGTTEAEDESGFSGSIKTIENKLSKAAGVTGALETLFEIDKINGTIKLQAGKLLEILSGGQLIVEADNYSLNEDGTVTITGGQIGGFVIDNNNIKRVDSDGNLFELTGGQAPGVYYSSENGKQYGYFGWHTGAGALTGGLEFILIDDSGSTTKVSLNESFMKFLNKTASNNQMFVRYGLDGIRTSGEGLTVDDNPVACKTREEVIEMINLLGTGTDTPQDDDYFVSQFVGGGDTTTTYHRRKLKYLWNYIKSKADSVYEAAITTLPISKGGTGETNRLESISLSSVKGTGSHGCRYYPYLKMCFLRMQVTGVAVEQGKTTVVGVVPSGYRPSYINALSVYYSGYGTIVKAQINSSGQIRILSSAALGTSASVYVTGWWIAS